MYVKYIAIYSIKGWVGLIKIVELTVFNMILHIQVTKMSGRIGVHDVRLENPITGMNLMVGKWMENNGYSQGYEHYSNFTETCTRVFTCIGRMLIFRIRKSLLCPSFGPSPCVQLEDGC